MARWNPQFIELDGRRYVILPEEAFRSLITGESEGSDAGLPPSDRTHEPDPLDPLRIAGRLLAWRVQTGWSQTELARRSGVRVETLNRLERGRTAPDFATVRKLVAALRQAEPAAPEAPKAGGIAP